MYGRNSIRAVNGFKQLHEADQGYMMDEMIRKMGPDFMMNPENSPKLPRYKNPKEVKKMQDESRRREDYRKSQKEGPDEPFPPGGL